MPVILAIETSQRIGGVALRDRDNNVQVEMLSEKGRHDDDLLPAIDRLFARAGLKPSDMEAVGVSIGPGGFTGLRIAVSTAKMFAEALGAKIIAVPSAAVAAESTADADVRSVLVALASKQDTAWFTRLRRGAEGAWSICGEGGLADAASLDLDGVDALLGDEFLPQSIRDRLSAAGIPVIHPQFDLRACLSVAERMLNTGEVVDPLHLAPLYPRQPEAVTIWDQRLKRASRESQRS
jgi:tRNA threonylcarbamoyladenosine biosynthesis protein TsaB